MVSLHECIASWPHSSYIWHWSLFSPFLHGLSLCTERLSKSKWSSTFSHLACFCAEFKSQIFNNCLARVADWPSYFYIYIGWLTVQFILIRFDIRVDVEGFPKFDDALVSPKIVHRRLINVGPICIAIWPGSVWLRIGTWRWQSFLRTEILIITFIIGISTTL